MREDRNFKFKVNISVDHYESKSQATSCLTAKGGQEVGKNKMSFIEKEVDIDEFVKKALEGHSFCGLFDVNPNVKYWIKRKNGRKMKMYPVYRRGASNGALKIEFKRNEFFKGAHAVFVDVDETRFDDVGEYIDSLTLKPSFVYMSYSDGKDKGGKVSRRFHMVYIFEEELDKNKFKEVSMTLTSLIEKDTQEKMEDICGERYSQYFNGCYGNNEVYVSYIVYSYDDIMEYKKEDTDNNTTIEDNSNYLLTIVELQKTDTFEKDADDAELFCENMVEDMVRLEYDEFMIYNRHKFRYFYRTESPEWVDDMYQLTDESYLALYYNKEKVTDGHKRRKKLFDRCCIRRLIDPDVDANTLLFNLYEDVHRFFDNSDEVLTIDKLKEKVTSSMSYTIEELKEMYSDTILYYKEHRPKVIFRSGIDIGERNSAIKEIRYDQLQEEYNQNLTVSENLAILKDKGYSISQRTLYSFVNSKEIPTKPGKQRILAVLEEHYDPRLSIRKNLTRLKAFVPGIKKNDVEKYKKSLGG